MATTGDPSEDEIMRYLRVDPAQAMKEQAKSFDAKKWVWVPKKGTDGYIAVEVISASGDDVQVKDQKGNELTVKKETCEQMNPPKYEKCSDMANLTYLNEASVLYNLRSRYTATLIYTYSGLFCIAVNPYRRLPIYNDTCIKMYRGKRKMEMPPHIFSIVDNAYQDMLQDHENQSMLITGESGAGKTENTKKVIMYIAKVAGVEKKASTPAPVANPDGHKIAGSLDEQIVEANPLMESFGNAKTIRNNNSSRFGKFIRAHFSQTGKLAGADIESYLLEKNRVTFQLPAERNYHIFYQLLYATSDELFAQLCLPTRVSDDYEFLKKGQPTVDAIDDNEEFALTENAMIVLGFTPEERISQYKIVSSLLNFGNIPLKQRPRDEQAEIADPACGERLSYLLGLNVGEFHKSLVKPKVKVGTEYVNKAQNMEQATFAITALSKSMYERMFLWQVVRINKALDTKERRSYFIGVLDIAGFEIFEYNSFDQLCINLTNEKLQQFFNHNMFVLEQEEYKKEGLQWDSIDFGMDLAQTIDLIEKPGGIFSMLEEECIVPKATDQTYLQKLTQAHSGKHPSFSKPSPKAKGKDGDFILHHYAGSVGYSVADWLLKNKDPISEDTAGLLSKATDPIIALLFQDYNPDAGTRRKGSAFQTVSFRHREQLKILLGILGETSPHFVRCIIPNEKKQPGEIDGDLTLHQLRCNGVLEGIRICRKGFPSRMLFQDFRQRYQILASASIPSGFIDGKVACEKLIEALQLDESEFRIGLTKVFFRAGIVGELEDMRDERLSKIISQFQAYCKGHLMRVEYKKLCDQRIGVAVIQRNVRAYFALRNWTWWKLYIKVQPLLSIARAEDEMKEKEEELKKALENAEQDAKVKKEMENKMTEMLADREKLLYELNTQTESLITAEEKFLTTQALKDSLEKGLNEALERLEEEEHGVSMLSEEKKKNIALIEGYTVQCETATANIARLESEKGSRDKNIEALHGEITAGEEALEKLQGEKKNVEEKLATTMEELQTSEDKGKKLQKEKQKLESNLTETEANLTREREAKAKLDKDKKRVEGILREAEASIDQLTLELEETKDTVLKRDKTIKEATEKIESCDNQIKALQKKIAELTARIEELEEELENERKAKQKVEKARQETSSELEALMEQLEEAGGMSAAQQDILKKREQEIEKLRKEMETNSATNEATIVGMKNKYMAELAGAQEEIDTVKKQKTKCEKEKASKAAEVDEIAEQLDDAKKKCTLLQKQNRAIEDKFKEANDKITDLEMAVSEAAANPSGGVDPAAVAAATEELEHKLGLAQKQIKNMDSQLEEAKDFSEAETKAKHDAQQKLKHALDEMEGLNEALEECDSEKVALQSKYSKAVQEAQQFKSKFEEEGQNRVEELEEAKKRLAVRVQDMESALSAAEAKASSMEKVKNRMNEEVEDLLLDLEKAQAQASNLEKKQKKVDSQIGEWKTKCDSIKMELDKAQKESRNYSTELLKLRALEEDSSDRIEQLKKENRVLTGEIASLTEQLSDGGKSSHEVEKLRRKLELEKEEIQIALEEAEGALEMEESHKLKIQLELSQLKAVSEKKMADREEENENSRKNHMRQLDSMQASLDSAQKASAEATKAKKRAEDLIGDLEGSCDEANRQAAEQAKLVKKLQQQIKDIGGGVDDEARSQRELREKLQLAEKRATELIIQMDEAKVQLDQTERGRKQLANEIQEHKDRQTEMQNNNNNLSNQKRKMMADMQGLQEEMDEIENDRSLAIEKMTKAQAEFTRSLTDVKQLQDDNDKIEKERALLSTQLMAANARAAEAEASGGKGLKSQIRKLEQRIAELENDVDKETRKGTEAVKNARRAEKTTKELQFQLDDESNAMKASQDNIAKLNSKIKSLKGSLDQEESLSVSYQTKMKKLTIELEDAEERAESAESALSQLRKRNARQATDGRTAPTSRARSRVRTPAPEEE